jgi:hypothetical protein
LSTQEGKSYAKLSQVIRALSLAEFCEMFGSLAHPVTQDPIQFLPWHGQRQFMDWLQPAPKNGEHGAVTRKEFWVPKARQLGISEIMSLLILKHMLSYPGSEGIVVSKSDFDSTYFLRKRLLPKLRLLPPFPGVKYPTIVEPRTPEPNDYIKLSNGSKMWSRPPTGATGASMTLHWIVYDEAGGIDKQPNASFEDMWKNGPPAVEKAVRAGVGWIGVVGTSEPGSFYNEELRKMFEGLKTPKYYFLDWKTDPSRDKEWERAERERLGSDADFLNQYPSNMFEFFATREGRVFPTFDPRENGETVFPFEENFRLPLMIGYDHGRRHWAAALFFLYDQDQDILYQFDELFWKGVDVDVIASDVNEKLNDYGVVPEVMLADGSIFNKDGRRSVAELLREAGLNFSPAWKADEAASRSLLSQRFTDHKVVIHPRCGNSIRQLTGYTWDPRTKGEKTIQVNDEAPDILRWLSAHIHKKEHGPGKAKQAVEKGPLPFKRARGRMGAADDIWSDNSTANSWQAM